LLIAILRSGGDPLRSHVILSVGSEGIEGMEYVSVFNLKIPSGMHVIVKNVLFITYLL